MPRLWRPLQAVIARDTMVKRLRSRVLILPSIAKGVPVRPAIEEVTATVVSILPDGS